MDPSKRGFEVGNPHFQASFDFFRIHGLKKLGSKLCTYIPYIYIYAYILLLHYDIIYICILIYISLDVLGDESFALS